MRRARETFANWSGDVVSWQVLVPVLVLAGRLCSCSCPLCVMKLPLSGAIYDGHDDARHWAGCAFAIRSVGEALLVALVCVVGRPIVSAAAHCE